MTFIDGFLQASAFTKPDRSLWLPVEIGRLDLRPDLHKQKLIDTPKGKGTLIGLNMTHISTNSQFICANLNTYCMS